MKELSRVASAVQASTTVAIDSKAKQMKADGIDVVGFGAGEPDFNTPDNINMEAIRAICDGKTKYTPPAGIIPLRKAICNRLKLDCNLDYDYTQIVVASGAKHCVYVTFRALLNPGDEVIVPAPYWVSYSEMIKMAGGVPILVVAGEDQGFKATGDQIKAAITEKTKCVIINNPSNPTGALYSKQELQEIADICVENDLYIISDEIYYQLIYDNAEFVSIASLGKDVYDHTIIINGVSKSSQEGIEAMRQEFEKRRNYMVKRMNEIPGVSCRMPEGAFYVMMNISQLLGKTIGGASINSADDFAMAFLDQGLVAVVPSTGFGIDNFVRWSYATSMENIEEGLNRLEKFLNQ